MSSSTIRWWLIGSVLVALALAPFLAQGDAAQRKRQADNVAEIKAMSNSEWARVERNFEAFQQLTPAEQEQVLAFHRQLSPSPEQKAALKNYTSWLATLEPFQRDRLNQVESPAERIGLMKTIMKEQQERSVERQIPDQISRIPAPVLSSSDLNRVMEEIENSSRSSLGLSQQKELKALTGVRRHYQLLKMLAKDPVGSETIPIFKEPPLSLKRVASNIDDLVKASEVREYFAKHNDWGSPEKRLAGVLMKSMLIELFQENKGRKPSTSEVQELFENLPPEEQDQLLNLEAADFYSDLSKRHQSDGDVSLDDLRELFITREMMEKHWRDRVRRGFESRRGEDRAPEGERENPRFRPGGRGPRGDGPDDDSNNRFRRPLFERGDGPPGARPERAEN